jgi:hypothetical protein
MEILPVDDLDIALHDFVSKDDKMAFYACLQRNLEETRVCFATFSIVGFSSFFLSKGRSSPFPLIEMRLEYRGSKRVSRSLQTPKKQKEKQN